MFSDQQPIAIVSLQMEEGTEEIKVYEGEDVELAVDLFCQRYGLGEDCMHYLVDQINQQLKREPSPRFGDDLGHKLSFGQKGPLQPSESKSSDVGITTQASSVDENTIQKTYEQWQKKINQRTVWGIPKQPKQSNADRLYREAMDQQKMKQERTQYLKQQKTRIEEMQATFKPMISPRSRALVNQKRQTGIDIGQQLYQKGIEMNLKKENKRIQHEEELKKLSPFRPNNTSRNQSKSPNRSSTPIYEKLFLQGKADQQLKEQFIKNEFSKIYTFHPQINAKSEVQDQQKYVEKLFKDSQDRQKKITQKQYLVQQIRREKSIQNQSTFQPSVIKDQTYQKVCKRQDYEDNMLANDLQKVKNKVESRNSFSSYQKQNQRHFSDASVLSQFDINVARIFNQLDEDKDGLISKEKLNLSAIDVSVLEIVSEALFKIEDENLTVNQNQFKQLCQSVEGLAQELNSFFMKL